MNREEIRDHLSSNGLARVAGKLADAALPSISIKTDVSTDNNLPIGSSKFGGLPDSPQGFTWPIWNERPMSFLCQFSLSDITGLDQDENLPSEGLLSFFYDSEQSTWGFDPKDRGSWAVQYFESSNLVRNQFPDELPAESRYTTCALKFASELTLPGRESPLVEELELNDDEDDAFFDSMLEGVNHHFLGYAQEVQGAMQLECQLASNGIYCGDPSGYADPRVTELEPGASEWRLLLQIDTDENPDWMWGDSGMLYFWIKSNDLRSRDFTKIWMVLQCC